MYSEGYYTWSVSLSECTTHVFTLTKSTTEIDTADDGQLQYLKRSINKMAFNCRENSCNQWSTLRLPSPVVVCAASVYGIVTAYSIIANVH